MISVGSGEGLDPAEHEDPQGGGHNHRQQNVRKFVHLSEQRKRNQTFQNGINSVDLTLMIYFSSFFKGTPVLKFLGVGPYWLCLRISRIGRRSYRTQSQSQCYTLQVFCSPSF